MRNATTALLLAIALGFPARGADDGKPATSERLGQLLRDMGYQPQALTEQVWQVTVRRDGWNVHIMVSLSADGERVWLECKFATVENPEIIPAKAWFNLLAANERIGPAYFAYDRADSRIHLYKAFDNVAVDNARLKKEIESFDAVVRKTQKDWRGENFAPSEMIPIVPRTVEEQPKKVSGLDGSWRIVRIERNGVSATAQDIGKNATAVFDGDRVTIRTDRMPERKVRVLTDPKANPKGIDFIDDNLAVEEGIYAFDEPIDLLTVCFAPVGGKRPTQFLTEENDKCWLMVLKRER